MFHPTKLQQLVIHPIPSHFIVFFFFLRVGVFFFQDRAPIGVKWASTWMVAMSTWPAYARPVPPVGDPTLKAVIIGNLHDPNTAYENAQHMKTAFPEGENCFVSFRLERD